MTKKAKIDWRKELRKFMHKAAYKNTHKDCRAGFISVYEDSERISKVDMAEFIKEINSIAKTMEEK